MIVNGWLVELFKSTVSGVLVELIGCFPNARLRGEKVNWGEGGNTVPQIWTLCGLPAALSVTLSTAVLTFRAVGRNWT